LNGAAQESDTEVWVFAVMTTFVGDAGAVALVIAPIEVLTNKLFLFDAEIAPSSV
jgi:hypothetical protein